MHTISFILKDYKSEFEIAIKLEKIGFKRLQQGLYAIENKKGLDNNGLQKVFLAMKIFENNSDFQKNLISIHACKMEDWSNFTDIILKNISPPIPTIAQ